VRTAIGGHADNLERENQEDHGLGDPQPFRELQPFDAGAATGKDAERCRR